MVARRPSHPGGRGSGPALGRPPHTAYFGAPPFFQEAFRHIGLLGLDGAPKRAYALLHRSRSGVPPTVAVSRLGCLAAPRWPSARVGSP